MSSTDAVFGAGKFKNVHVTRVTPDSEGVVIGLTLDDNLVATEVAKDGQCHGKVHEGDKLVLVNGTPVKEIMKDSDTQEDLFEHLRSQSLSDEKEGPLFLTFNYEEDANFMQLLKQGFEVEKSHSTAIFCMSSGKRILYIDEQERALIIGKKKGDPTKKVFSIHELVDVTRLSDTSFEIHAKNGDSIKLSVQTPNADACRLLVAKLHALVILTHCKNGTRHETTAHSDDAQDSKNGTCRGKDWWKK